ncbi:hypothetical protein ACIXKZ_21690, partial [Bacteroides fragilis]
VSCRCNFNGCRKVRILFSGRKGHPSSYGTWKIPRTGSKSKANQNSRNKSFNKLQLWQKQVGAM